VDPPRPAVVYGLLSLAVGVGCSRGVTAGEIIELVQAALAEAGLTAASVAAMASVDAKRDEDGLLEAAAHLGWPLHLHPAGELTRVQVPNPSAAAERADGTPSVAEAAALAEAAGLGGPHCDHRAAPRGRP
jgi:cobalt-precorrin 5A hydrolase/precorrin-3B C17-methyltransferase